MRRHLATLVLTLLFGCSPDESIPGPDVCAEEFGGKSTRLVSIQSSSDGSCVLRENGTVVCWGLNDEGQLQPLPDTLTLPLPTVIRGARCVRDLHLGSSSACALLAGGTLRCWGNTRDASGKSDMQFFWPLGTVAALFGGGLGNGWGALGVDGRFWVWGEYVLVDEPTFEPVQWSSVLPFRDIDLAQRGSSCLIRPDGTVWCWGYNTFGLLQKGRSDSDVLVAIDGISNAVSVRAADRACATTGDGSLYCWGVNSLGQLGNGMRITSLVPGRVKLSPDGAVRSFALGEDHTCAAMVDGTVQCWGEDQYGQTGIMSAKKTITEPHRVEGLENVVEVSAGAYFSCARTADDRVFCWGDNTQLALGVRNVQFAYSPVELTLPSE